MNNIINRLQSHLRCVKTVLAGLLFIAGLFLSPSMLASQAVANQISVLSSSSVYNLANDDLPAVLSLFLTKDQSIKALKIVENGDNEVFLTFFNKGGKQVFNKPIPERLLKFKAFDADVLFEKQIIGQVTIWYETASSLSLTKEENAWIKANPVIQVGGDSHYAPFDFVNDLGKHAGLSWSYLDEISKLTGLKMVVGADRSWDESLLALKSGDLDMLPLIAKNQAREAYINFTNPYFGDVDFYFTHEDYPEILNLKELEGKKVSVVKGFDIVNWLKAHYPEVIIVEKETISAALQSISTGESVAFIGSKSVTNYSVNAYQIHKIKLNSRVKERRPLRYYMGVKKGFEPLQSILSKAISAMSNKTKKEIQARWLVADKTRNNIEFSEQELLWLDKKHVIRYSEVNWKPMSIIENGRLTGVMGDYLNIVGERAGVTFEFVPANSWLDVLDLFSRGEIDLIPGASGSPSEAKMGAISDKYVSYPMVIVSNDNVDFVRDLSSMTHETFSVPKGYTSYNELLTVLPGANIVDASTVLEAMTNVSQENANLFIGHITTALYGMEKLQASNLKIAGYTEFKYNHHFLISSDYPELLSIVNKVFATITLKEREKIYHDWVHTEINESFDIFLIAKMLFALFVVFAFISYYAMKLNKQRKLAEKALLLQEASEEKTRLLLTSVGEGVFGVGADGLVNFINPAALSMLQYSEVDILGKKIHAIIHHSYADGSDFPVEACSMYHALRDGKVSHVDDEVLWRKDGSYFPVSYKAYPMIKDGVVTGSVVTFSDTSERQLAQAKLKSEMADRLKSEELAKVAKQRLENMTNAIPSVVIQIQLGSTLHYVSYVSENIRKLHGITPTDVRKSLDCFYDSIHEDDRQEVKDRINYIDGQNLGLDYRVIQEDKSIKWMRLEATIARAPKDESADIIFSSDTGGGSCWVLNGSLTDITEAVLAKNAIQELHKHTRDSIEYAALIQRAIIPNSDVFARYFDDYFASWVPKDIVGGDVFLFEELKHQDGCIIMVIDCTGHGVPGAFVTMLVKAIERQVDAIVRADKGFDVSPAWILSYFNKNMRMLLKQDDVGSESNAGFDGGIIYYNRTEQIIKYSGAETPLFYIEDDNLKTIKGSRHSVGYKKSDPDYQFKEHTIVVKSGMQFYLSTDGVLDQNGGHKGFPYGKKQFANNVFSLRDKPFAEQTVGIFDHVIKYQGDQDRNDDMCVIGFKI